MRTVLEWSASCSQSALEVVAIGVLLIDAGQRLLDKLNLRLHLAQPAIELVQPASDLHIYAPSRAHKPSVSSHSVVQYEREPISGQTTHQTR